jgi:hypothetical protein
MLQPILYAEQSVGILSDITFIQPVHGKSSVTRLHLKFVNDAFKLEHLELFQQGR